MSLLGRAATNQEAEISFRRHVLGPDVSKILEDSTVIEVMVNADGGVWVEHFGGAPSWSGVCLTPGDADRTMRLIATHAGTPVTARHPRLSATLPTGERFQGELAPICERAIYSIRKPAQRCPSLTELVSQDILSPRQCVVLETALSTRQNILVAGSTSSGKTALVNALLNHPIVAGDRIIVLEDTTELRCSVANHVQLRTVPSRVSMSDLLYDALRLRPDRVVIGEVRDGAALDILKAWNTGHPGGFATLHANSAEDSLRRIEELVSERTAADPRAMIARAINLIVFMRRTRTFPIVENIVKVEGLDPSGYVLRESGT
jgi:type IV secretion system protein VirB11